MIEEKERTLPLYVDILQRPTRLRNSTADIADWLLYFSGSDLAAQSADVASYARLKGPVAILWGEKDTVTPLDQARDLQRRIAQAQLVILPGLGHIPQIENPEAFHAALLRAIGNP